MQFLSLGQEDPLEERMQPTPVFLPGEFYGQRSLVGYSPWGCKESVVTEVAEHTRELPVVLQLVYEPKLLNRCRLATPQVTSLFLY